MRFVFDATIAFILFFSAYWAYILIRSFFYDRETRHYLPAQAGSLRPPATLCAAFRAGSSARQARNQTKLIRGFLIICLTAVYFLVFWGSFIESRRLVVRHVPINLKTTAKHEQIKIAFLSDFHVGPYKKTFFVKQIVKNVIKQKPDVVLLGGDYILGGDGSNAKYLAPLKDLSARYPVYAVTGNHEYHLADENDPHQIDRTAVLRALFENLNIKILENKTAVLNIAGNKFNLTGLPEIWTHKANFQIAAINQDPRLLSILLVHNPEIILNENAEKYELVVAGHTHGGQIRLPFIGSLAPLPTKLGRYFDQGLFSTKNGYLYISSGLGESGARARLFDPPEISILTIDL